MACLLWSLITEGRGRAQASMLLQFEQAHALLYSLLLTPHTYTYATPYARRQRINHERKRMTAVTRIILTRIYMYECIRQFITAVLLYALFWGLQQRPETIWSCDSHLLSFQLFINICTIFMSGPRACYTYTSASYTPVSLVSPFRFPEFGKEIMTSICSTK